MIHRIKRRIKLNHGSKPLTRREAIGRGFMFGGSVAIVPSVLTEVLAKKAFGAECGDLVVTATERIPLIQIDLAGGYNAAQAGWFMAGSGVGGEFPTSGMDSNGMGSNTPVGLGGGNILAFQGSAVETTFNQVATQTGVPANLLGNGCKIGYACITNDDSSNGPFGDIVRYYIEGNEASGIPGVDQPANMVSKLMGDNARGSRYQTSITTEVTVDQIQNVAAARALLDSSAAGAAFGGLANLQNALKMGQDVSALRFQQHALDANVANNLECAYQESARILADNSPEQIDYTLDPNFQGLEGIATGLGVPQDEAQAILTHAKSVLDGYAVASTATMGGYDYHNDGQNSQTADNTAMAAMVFVLGAAAVRSGKPLIVQLVSDGASGGGSFQNGTRSDAGDHCFMQTIVFGTSDLAAGTPLITPQLSNGDPQTAQYGRINAAGISTPGDNFPEYQNQQAICQVIHKELAALNGLAGTDGAFLMPFYG